MLWKCGQVENMFVLFSEVPTLHLNPEISCCDVFHGLSADDWIMSEIRSYLLPPTFFPVHCYLIKLSFMLYNLSQQEQIN
jgi:hypothetical protein